MPDSLSKVNVYNIIPYHSVAEDVSNSSDFLKYEMAVGTSSKAKALTANLDALCASTTCPAEGL